MDSQQNSPSQQPSPSNDAAPSGGLDAPSIPASVPATGSMGSQSAHPDMPTSQQGSAGPDEEASYRGASDFPPEEQVPMTNPADGSPVLHADGSPVMMNPDGSPVPNADGMIPQMNEDGSPVLNEDGSPVLEEAPLEPAGPGKASKPAPSESEENLQEFDLAPGEVPIKHDPHCQKADRFPVDYCGVQPDWAHDIMKSELIFAKENLRVKSGAKPFGPVGMTFTPEQNKRHLTVGPVIGLVTDTTVRILLESDQAGPCTIYLAGQDETMHDTHKTRKTVELGAKEPRTVEITGLMPRYNYNVMTSVPFTGIVGSRFKTTAPAGSELKDSPFSFAVVSGNSVHTYVEPASVPAAKGTRNSMYVNRYVHETSASLWKDLYQQINKGQVRMVIHLGNNIQIGGKNSLFRRAIFEKVTEEEAREFFRDEYRRCWNEPWTKHVLANCSNIMILNETDIGNFTKAEFFDPQSWRIALSAFDVFREYQQSLMGKTGAEMHPNDILCHWTAKISPQIGLLVLDWRMPITFGNMGLESEPELLGHQQKKRLASALKKTFNYDNENRGQSTNALIVLSSACFGNVDSHIHEDKYINDVCFVIDKLFEWRDKNAPRNLREVVILSSAEMGKASGRCDIIRPNKEDPTHDRIHEFIVGPISTPAWRYKAVNLTGRFSRDVYDFVVHEQSVLNNYCLFRLTTREESTTDDRDAHMGKFIVHKPTFFWQRRTCPAVPEGKITKALYEDSHNKADEPQGGAKWQSTSRSGKKMVY